MPLTPEQQDLRKDALTLKRLFPAYRPEHTVAEGFLALLAQVEAQEAPAKETMGELLARKQVPKAAHMAGLHAAAPLPIFDMTKHVDVTVTNSTDPLYGWRLPDPVASPPGSAGSGESINTVESLSAAEGSMEDFADAADLVDAMTAAEAKGDALGLVLAYRHKVRSAALSQPVQAVPDGWRDLIEWLLGKNGPFPARNSATEGLYWWRKELRARYEKLSGAAPGDPAQ